MYIYILYMRIYVCIYVLVYMHDYIYTHKDPVIYDNNHDSNINNNNNI